MYTLRSNTRTVHIEGIPAGTKVTGDGEDNGSGVVAYYAQSACSALTRGATRMAVGESFHTLADALAAAGAYTARGFKVCTRCTAAAERYLAETMFMCTTCGTTDPSTLCLVPDPYHPGARELTRAEYEQYKAERYPTAGPCTPAEPEVEPELVAPVRQFVCLSCGATDESAGCYGGTVHRDPHRMLPADFQRYTESRRPVDKAEAEARRASLRATREALAAHDAQLATAETLADHESELAESEPARALYLAARIAMAAGRTLRSCDGSEARPHVISPAYVIAERLHSADMRFCVFVEGMAVIYAPTLPEALAKVPEALAGVLAEGEPGDLAAVGCVSADLHECWSLALTEDPAAPIADPEPEPEAPVHPALAAVYAATAALTPERARLALAVGSAYTTDNTDHEKAPAMTKYQVIINQVVTTTVYLEAPDRDAAEALAIEELPELCAQCAGMGPRQSPNVTDVNTYVNDHYDEPEVTELDENGCIKATPEEEATAAETFARVMTAESINRDGSATEKTHATHNLAEVVAELDQFHEAPAPILFDLDPQGNPTTFGPSMLVNPDPVNLDNLPDHIMAGTHLEPATRERLGAAEELAALDHMTEIAQRGAERERAYDLAQREYLYLAERYARTGDGKDGERLDNALERYHLAAFAANRCAAIGVDWSCGEATERGEATCEAHRGTVTGKAVHHG
jgi:hypothetical protein